MSFLDKLFERFKSKPATSDAIRQALIDARASGRKGAFARLCLKHRETIQRQFAEWSHVPKAIANDPTPVERYADAMITVASFFAEELGERALLESLQQTESDPFHGWDDKLGQAFALSNELRYEQASVILTTLAREIEASDAPGTRPGYMLVRAFGLLSVCYFHSGKAEAAVAAGKKALELCEKQNDVEGLLAYIGNLYEAHRYLGDGQTAATLAERLSHHYETAGRTGEAQRFRKLGAIARAGEPLNRVVCQVGEETLELDEVSRAGERRLRFGYARNRIELRPSEELTQQGSKLAGSGDDSEALKFFEKAETADPFNPQPAYERALSLLHLRRYVEAVKAYEKTEALAPGWFNCRSERWLAQELAAGRVPHAAFLALRELEDGSSSPAEKVALGDKILRQGPELALVHLHSGAILVQCGERQRAEGYFRRGLEVAEEADVKTRILVQLAVLLEASVDRRRCFQEAVQLNGNLMAAAQAAVALRCEHGVNRVPPPFA